MFLSTRARSGSVVEEGLVAVAESTAIVLDSRRRYGRVAEIRVPSYIRRPFLAYIAARRVEPIVIAALCNVIDCRRRTLIDHCGVMCASSQRKRR